MYNILYIRLANLLTWHRHRELFVLDKCFDGVRQRADGGQSQTRFSHLGRRVLQQPWHTPRGEVVYPAIAHIGHDQ